MEEGMRYEDPPHTEGEGYSAVADALDRLRDEIGQRHVENTSSLEVVEGKLNEAISRIDDLHRAFPEGDPDAHRRYHETLIAKAEAKARFYEDLRADLAKKGLWAVILFVGGAVWFYVKSKFIR